MSIEDNIRVDGAHIKNFLMETERVEFDVTIKSAKLEDIAIKGTLFIGRKDD